MASPKDEYGLTRAQRTFADEYIANKGNATKAYFKAYPHITNVKTAQTNGSRLLRTPVVTDYIHMRTIEVMEAQKMSADEIISSLVEIARREIKTSYSQAYDHISGEVEKEVTYKFQPNIEEQTKALELLAKFSGVDNPNNDLTRKRMELENEKLKSQIGGSESQDDKIADYITLLKEAIEDES